MKIDIDPKKKLFKWGPIDGRLIYIDYFNIGFTHYGKKFYGWPSLFLYFKKEKITIVVNYQKLYNSGEINFRRYILDKGKFKKNYFEWENKLHKLLTLQKNINPEYLKNLDNNEFIRIFKKWSELYLAFWTIGELPELANWGGESMLRRELKKSITDKNFNYILEKLSVPEDLSFYKKAELELFKLKKFIKNKKLFEKKLANYQQKYFHILNSYYDTQLLNINYFREELTSHSLAVINNKIKELNNLPQKIKAEKKEIIKKYNLNKNVAKISKKLAYCIWWQDLRKFYIFRANYHIDLFLQEIKKRYKVTFDNLHFYSYKEILNLIKNNKKIAVAEIRKRHKYLMVYYTSNKNSLEYLAGRKAKKLADPYINLTINKNAKIFKGTIVSGGEKIKAKVKILYSPKEADKLKKGEILVVAMTSPDYIVAMKKASAIITDEGGLTCHAAIISRELDIPCIVGTKIATHILKDGDVVEIDADEGIIKIIK